MVAMVGFSSRTPVCLVLLFAGLGSACGRDAAAAENDLSFRLPTTSGKTVELLAPASDDRDAGGVQHADASRTAPRWTVVCFLGVECPLARLYAPRLSRLANEFRDRGVRFIGVDSNQQDSMAELREFAKNHRLSFPLAQDIGNRVADQYGATRTPQVFVVDAQLELRYQGRIDDQYQPGLARPEPTRHDLRRTLQELVSGQAVSEPETEAVGCLIGRVRTPQIDSDVTWCQQISRVLQRHCVECHRPGEIGPFSLIDYDEAIGWAEMLVEVVDDGRMPPWHASPEHGEFANVRFMPDSDRRLLREWVAAGMPYGDPGQLPERVAYDAGWNLPRAPDLILPMREKPFVVPAEGTIDYQYYVVDPGFEEDRWVVAAQLDPGNRSVVHHGIVFIRPPDGSAFRGIGWLTGYVPGQRFSPLPQGYARRVPAGSKLVFQMHYTPSGRVQADLSRVGLVFGDAGQVTHEVLTVMAIEQEFDIPPHSRDVSVSAQPRWYPPGGQLLSIIPHMHLRGDSFRLMLREAGESRILLDVPEYDFNWQHCYELAEPLPLREIDALRATFTFDNSRNNPVNPDPSQHVTWGDQTWEEMAVAFLQVAQPLEQRQPTSRAEATRRSRGKNAQSDDAKSRDAASDAFVRDFFKRFDGNADGQVESGEVPLSLRRFGFRHMDRDGNERLSPEEVRRAFRTRQTR